MACALHTQKRNSKDHIVTSSFAQKDKKTILVVEDNEDVRDVAVNMLLEEGFNVLTAADAKSGLETFNNNPEIDLVFSDVILPGGFSGIDMAKIILGDKPNSLFLLTTGYREKGEELIKNAGLLDNIVFIPKPYDVSVLPNIIYDLIEKSIRK